MGVLPSGSGDQNKQPNQQPTPQPAEQQPQPQPQPTPVAQPPTPVQQPPQPQQPEVNLSADEVRKLRLAKLAGATSSPSSQSATPVQQPQPQQPVAANTIPIKKQPIAASSSPISKSPLHESYLATKPTVTPAASSPPKHDAFEIDSKVRTSVWWPSTQKKTTQIICLTFKFNLLTFCFYMFLFLIITITAM